MSLVRLALRAATVAALNNNEVAPFPTIAGPLCWDSKQDPLHHIEEETVLPAIVVYTGSDSQEKMDRGNGRVWAERQIELVIECIIGTWTDPNLPLAPVEMDSEMEAMLDIFEWQVWRALNNPFSDHAVNFQKLVKRFDAWSSDPVRDAEQANRHAIRQIRIVACVNNDCMPSANILPNGQVPGTPPEVSSYIDVPYLAAINNEITNSPSFEVLREQLREVITGVPSTTVPALSSIHMKTDAIDPADPNRLPPGETQGPDGRIEYEINVNMETDE